MGTARADPSASSGWLPASAGNHFGRVRFSRATSRRSSGTPTGYTAPFFALIFPRAQTANSDSIAFPACQRDQPVERPAFQVMESERGGDPARDRALAGGRGTINRDNRDLSVIQRWPPSGPGPWR